MGVTSFTSPRHIPTHYRSQDDEKQPELPGSEQQQRGQQGGGLQHLLLLLWSEWGPASAAWPGQTAEEQQQAEVRSCCRSRGCRVVFAWSGGSEADCGGQRARH